jgi:glycosyltransferase involved in cell wall biosynthesis
MHEIADKVECYLSVIIPTRNRELLLARCLESICDQSFPQKRFEVLVIDNGSTDDTAAVCKKFRGWLPNLQYHYEPSPGQHAGRNKGLRLAKGEFLVYGDDDIRAVPSWLEGIAETFEDPTIALVGGKNIAEYEVPPPQWVNQLWLKTRWGRHLGYYSLVDFGDSVCEIPPHLVYGCNFSIRKCVLLEVGGFHPDVMPREKVLYMGDGDSGVSWVLEEKGYRAMYNPRASVYHFISSSRLTTEYLEYRLYGQGISDSYTRIRRSNGVVWTDDVIAFARRMRSLVKSLGNSFRRNLWKAYWLGYDFHRDKARRDPELLEWVLRRSYLEDATE